MALNAGILIIGSLIWDDRRGRPAWRAARLDRASAQAVTAPIRYGRLSESRGNTYTMVYSRLCKLGQGKLLRCTRPISTPAELMAEAEALWKAEQPGAAPGRIACNWGCVALLCNPSSKVPDDLLKAWADRVAREPAYGNMTQTQEEGTLVGEDGLLRMDWPRLVENGTSPYVDVILVTANDPEISASRSDYPDANTIAAAWNAAPSRYAEYFWNNVANGICTFQDEDIRTRLNPRKQA